MVDGTGWVTAEYGMLPRSTGDRIDRRRAATSGRSREIERLIGRSLRAIIDLSALGECSVTIDCDVLRADGGNSHGINHGRIRSTCACRRCGSNRPQDPQPRFSATAFRQFLLESSMAGVC